MLKIITSRLTGFTLSALVLAVGMCCVAQPTTSTEIQASTFRTTDLQVDNTMTAGGMVGLCASHDVTCANQPHFIFNPTTGQTDLSGTGATFAVFRALENVLQNPVAATASQQINQTIQGGTFDTTAGILSGWAGEFGADSSRSAGANNLINTALLLHARNGQVNYAIDSTTGDWLQEDAASTFTNVGLSTLAGGVTASATVDLSAATSIKLNNTVTNFEVPGSTTVNPVIGAGTQVSDDTQIQTKNTRTAGSTAGIDIGIDTTVNAASRGGLFISRGAAGNFGTDYKGLWCSGGNDLSSDIAADDLTLYNLQASKSLLFITGGTGTAHTPMRIGPTGNVELMHAAHLITTGDAISLSAGAGCGAGPTCDSTTCNDIAGTFTVGAGTTTCTLTFARTYGNADDAGCVLQAIGVNTVPTFTTTATTIAASVILPSQKYHYICPGH